jgi:hypothetical protein
MEPLKFPPKTALLSGAPDQEHKHASRILIEPFQLELASYWSSPPPDHHVSPDHWSTHYALKVAIIARSGAPLDHYYRRPDDFYNRNSKTE